MKIIDLQSFLNGDIVRHESIKKQYPLLGLLLGLVFIYILFGYISEAQQHQLSDIKKEVKDLRFRYLTISAELMQSTRQSRVASLLKEQGSDLKENTTPVTLISNKQ